MFKQIKRAELAVLRKKQWNKQKERCPIFDTKIPYSDAVMDHKHRIGKDPIGKNGGGLLRGVLHKQANVLEGKILKAFKRFGGHNFIDLPSFLRNLAKYLETPPMKPLYIHPNEAPKTKQLGIRNQKKINKYYLKVYPNRKKIPKLKIKSKLSSKLQGILDDIDVYLKGEKG